MNQSEQKPLLPELLYVMNAQRSSKAQMGFVCYVNSQKERTNFVQLFGKMLQGRTCNPKNKML